MARIVSTDEKAVFSLLANQGLLAPGEKPEFQWYKDGATYDPEERFKVSYQDEEDTLALVFQHVKPEDAGLYTCVAATSSGKIFCSAHRPRSELLRIVSQLTNPIWYKQELSTIF